MGIKITTEKAVFMSSTEPCSTKVTTLIALRGGPGDIEWSLPASSVSVGVKHDYSTTWFVFITPGGSIVEFAEECVLGMCDVFRVEEQAPCPA